MSHFEFVIPLQRDELTVANEPGHYVVRCVSDLADLQSSVHDLVVALSTDRSEFVLEKFDLLYSAIVHFSSLKLTDREQIWEVVNKGYVYLTADLSALLDTDDGLDSETRLKYLNMLKMSTYALAQLTEAFEEVAQRPSDVLITGKGRKRTVRSTADDNWDWEGQRLRVLRQLYTISQLQLRRLWDPPVPEEEFVNAIGNVCYHFLALPSVGHVRNKPLRDGVFQVLGTLVRSYGHSLSCSLKMTQMLQQYEHTPAPLAQGAVIIATEYAGRGLINDMVREIAGTDAQELTKDGAATRHYAEFLSLVAVQSPDLVLNNICLLIGHLDGESHLMRNAVLSILGDMVSLVLNGEQLEEKQRKIRDEFLEHLEQHMHDVHAFVRTKVLQIWRKLMVDGRVPLSRQRTVLRLTTGRLQDKSSNVRRAALQLVTAFLQANPFAAKLPVAELEEQYRAEKAKLAALGVDVEEELADENVEDGDDEVDEEEDALIKALAKARKQLVATLMAVEAAGDASDNSPLLESRRRLLTLLSGTDADEDVLEMLLSEPRMVPGHAEEAGHSQSREIDNQTMTRDQLTSLLETLAQNGVSSDSEKQIEIDRQRLMVLYFRDSVGFALLIDESIPGICAFLGSAQVTDVLEAISFFVTAFEFGLLKAIVGIRQMLRLIWSREAAVKDAVVEAYKRLYIPNEGNARFRASQTVANLSALCEDASPADLESLQELVVQLVGSDHVDAACIQLLWERFTGATGATGTATGGSSRRAALLLIGMVAGAEVSVVSSNLDVLVEHGLRGSDDRPVEFRMVQSVCNAVLKMAPKKTSADNPLPPLRLSPDHQLFVLLADFLVDGLSRTDDMYFSPMAQAALDVIYQLSDQPDSMVEDVLRRLSTAVAGGGSGQLARWLAVIGHAALCQLSYLDVHVFTELKRRNHLREKATGKRGPAGSQDTPNSASSTPANRRRSQEGEEDDGLMGAAADDAEAEYINNLCEHHVVTGDGLLATYLPLLVEVNSMPDRYPDRRLRAAAALALSKFMLVSSVLCEEHLQLLFTVLERSTDDVIRSNTIVALGDMSFRFPNLIEPWTPNIYARLRDDSVRVRKTTLTVLTQLIINDMVKVKGQISEVAERLVDDEENLRGMAREFFSELSQKGNALYNVMPDIVSRLSDPAVGLPEPDFRTVLQFVLGLIQKDRQLESLVEKLCHRLRAATGPRQWRDLAFCLSLLNFSDRCVKKLLENFSCFAEKLHEKEVYECFTKITSGAKKLAKSNEARLACDELESRLLEAHEKAVEDDNAATGAVRAGRKQAAADKPTRGRDGQAGLVPTPRRSALSSRQRRSSRRRHSCSSSDQVSGDDNAVESSDESEEEAKPKENGVGLQPPGKSRGADGVQQASSGDEAPPSSARGQRSSRRPAPPRHTRPQRNRR